MSDMVNHPPHYTFGTFEVIEVIEDWKLNYNLGNAVKYIARAAYKGRYHEDLQKATWYVQREIERITKKGIKDPEEEAIINPEARNRGGSMTVVWCDTETTGLDPKDSGPFELAFLVYQGGICKEEKIFHLNPLNEEVIIHQDALEVNGATEDQIRGYPPAQDVVPDLVAFFGKYAPPEKLVFAGYNCPFDYKHLGALLFRHGVVIADYFNGRFIDVLELVKKAKGAGLLEATRDNKLETITKSLGISHEAAHTALADITATRQVYETIYRIQKGGNR
jgi:DNA polymerase III epsilon subunit-like protein